MIGPHLINALLLRGYLVRALCRHEPLPGLLPPEVEIVSGDICDRKVVTMAMQGVDIAYHLAARLHSSSLVPNEVYQRINVDGTQNLIEVAAIQDLRRLVYFSTVKVYGKKQRQPVTETEHPDPSTIYAKTKLDGENFVRTAQNIPTTILRLSAVFGPNLKGSWAKLIEAIAAHHFLPVGHLENVHSLTYVEDVVHAAILAAESTATIGQCYNVVGYENPTLRQIMTAIYAGFTRSLPRWTIPMPVARAGVSTLSTLGRVWPRACDLADGLDQLTGDEVYSGVALRKLGFEPRTTLEAAWHETIASRFSTLD